MIMMVREMVQWKTKTSIMTFLLDVKCYDNHDHIGVDHHRMDVLLPEKAPKVGHSMFLMNVFLSNILNPLSLPFISISS